MIRRLISASLALLLAAPVLASMEEDGAWGGGVWAPTAWSDGAWLGGDQGPPATVEVPNCAAMDEATCVAAVEGEDLVANVVERCSNTVADGDVINTIPPSGTELEEGSAVSVLVSNGAMCPASGGSGKRFGIGIGIEVN